jgi:hypothetical protein
MIKDQRESTAGLCTAFYSSNAGSPHRPELHIVYDKHVVYTRLACDGLFRDTVGGSWKTTARNALEEADDQFEAVFGIDFLLRSSEEIKEWTSPIDTCTCSPTCSPSHTNGSYSAYWHLEPTEMMWDARADPGVGSNDVIACLTGAPVMKYWVEWPPYYTNCPGCQSGPACIAVHNFDYCGELMQTWKALRHEMSHFFEACNHDYDPNDPIQCVMTCKSNLTVYWPYGWCESCKTTISTNKAKYD